MFDPNPFLVISGIMNVPHKGIVLTLLYCLLFITLAEIWPTEADDARDARLFLQDAPCL